MARFLEVFRLSGREPSTSDDVENELQYHLAEMEDLLMARGATREVAREEARRRLGDIERLRKELRMMAEDTRRTVRRKLARASRVARAQASRTRGLPVSIITGSPVSGSSAATRPTGGSSSSRGSDTAIATRSCFCADTRSSRS